MTAEPVEGALGREEAVGPKREWEGTRSLLTQYLTQLPSAVCFQANLKLGNTNSMNEVLLTQDSKLCNVDPTGKLVLNSVGLKLREVFRNTSHIKIGLPRIEHLLHALTCAQGSREA